MKVGYARTSTRDQEAGLDAQLRDLKVAGCEEIFEEQVSSVDVLRREKLEAALQFVRKGDTLVITKIDRLARSVRHLHEIVERLQKKGVHFQILSLGIDTGTPIGKLILTMIGGIAQFEREIMLERQREGIAKAKADGKYKGRIPTARCRSARILQLSAQGMKPEDIAALLSEETNARGRLIGAISVRSVYRVLSDARKKTVRLAA